MVAVVYKIQSHSKKQSQTKLEFFYGEIPFDIFFFTFSTVSECGESKNKLFFVLAPKKCKKIVKMCPCMIFRVVARDPRHTMARPEMFQYLSLTEFWSDGLQRIYIFSYDILLLFVNIMPSLFKLPTLYIVNRSVIKLYFLFKYAVTAFRLLSTG